ncbi:MAG TPA: DUF4389 domain-containing protein [Gemmatimonadaceae bacterium]|nr:DUF4389 domain-containing protein [Gemmatimonadaceae bacterium]
MTTAALHRLDHHPVEVEVTPQLTDRNRLTCAFRPLLAIPHIILVGVPAALAVSLAFDQREHFHSEVGAGGGVMGVVAVTFAVIAWFAIVFGAAFPRQLWHLAARYMDWRVRVAAYVALLRDEYPPFGEGPYATSLLLEPPPAERNRLTVAFRLILALPHIAVVWVLGWAWMMTTIVAWFAILFTGRFPEALYEFGVGVLRWSTRVEVYLLLLRDEYPPFSLR